MVGCVVGLETKSGGYYKAEILNLSDSHVELRLLNGKTVFVAYDRIAMLKEVDTG